MTTDQLVQAPVVPTVEVSESTGTANMPLSLEPQPDPSGERGDLARLTKIVILDPLDAPANELSIRHWLTDVPQWVQDERQTASVVGISKTAVVIGRPDRPTSQVPLTVNGTLASDGLTITCADGATVCVKNLPPSDTAPDPNRLRTLSIDPVTGQLYIG
jgi:hypothetical protein